MLQRTKVRLKMLKRKRSSMEKLHNFIERTSQKKEKTFRVKEGNIMTEKQLLDEYCEMERTTQAMISFEGYCEIRTKMKR